jgi:uncharacterized protein (TIGR03437 family)
MSIRVNRHAALIVLFIVGSAHISQAQYLGPGAPLSFDAPADTALTPAITLPFIFTLTSAVSTFPNVPFELSGAYVAGANAGTPNFLSITPTRGMTPAEVSIALNPNVVPYLPPGEYSISVIFRSTDPAHPGSSTFPIGLSLHGQITVTISGVANSASQQAAFAPGTIITIYGSYLGTQPVSATLSYSTGFGNMTVYPNKLGNTTLSIGGFAAPLLYVSPSQINAVVPYELLGVPGTLGVTADVVVTHNGIASSPFSIPVSEIAPAIFTAAGTGRGQGAISNVDPQTGAATTNSLSNPAPKGSATVLYATGGGQLTQSSGDGTVLVNELDPPYYAPLSPVSLTIGGQPATILYAGAAPGAVSGLLQINAVVPTGIASGAQPIVLTIGTNSSQQGVTVAVQ